MVCFTIIFVLILLFILLNVSLLVAINDVFCADVPLKKLLTHH